MFVFAPFVSLRGCFAREGWGGVAYNGFVTVTCSCRKSANARYLYSRFSVRQGILETVRENILVIGSAARMRYMYSMIRAATV